MCKKITLFLFTIFVSSSALASVSAVVKEASSSAVSLVAKKTIASDDLPLTARKIQELANKINHPSSAQAARREIGDLNLSLAQQERLFIEVAKRQKVLSHEEAERLITNLGGVPGFSSTLSKIVGANFNKSNGHLTELRVANEAHERGFRVKAIGKRFNDGLKKRDSDIDLVLERNGKTYAIEIKDYQRTVPKMDMIRGDNQTLIAYKGRDRSKETVFMFTKRPPLEKEKLINDIQRRTGTIFIYGEPKELIAQLHHLS